MLIKRIKKLDLFIKQMSAREMMNFQGKFSTSSPESLSQAGTIDMGITLLAYSLCDKDGKLLYDASNPDILLDMPFPELKKLLELAIPEILKINGLEATKSLKNSQENSSSTN